MEEINEDGIVYQMSSCRVIGQHHVIVSSMEGMGEFVTIKSFSDDAVGEMRFPGVNALVVLKSDIEDLISNLSEALCQLKTKGVDADFSTALDKDGYRKECSDGTQYSTRRLDGGDGDE